MRPAPALQPGRLAVLAALLVAAGAWAGEPIPDVDVILEQIPGGEIMNVEEATGSPFDRVDFKDLPKDFAEAMDGALLPAGWSLHKEGKKVSLQGPPPGKPLRLKIHIGDVQRPQTMSYEVSHQGRKLLARQKQPVKMVAKQQVVGSLQGIVQMPTQVAPGEAMQMKVLDPSALPAGGTWSLSGHIFGTVYDDPPPVLPSRVVLVVPPGRGEEVPDQALEDIAAMLAARGVPEGSWEVVPLSEGDALLNDPTVEIWAVARDTATTSTKPLGGVPGVEQTKRQQAEIAYKPPAGLSNVMKMKHQMSRQVIGNIRAIASKPQGEGLISVYSVRPADARETVAGPVIVVTGMAISEDDTPLEDSPPTDDPALFRLFGCDSPQQSKRCCRKAGGGWAPGSDSVPGFCFLELETDKCYLTPIKVVDPSPIKIDLDSCHFNRFSIAEKPGGGVVHSFDISGPRARGPVPTKVEATISPDGTVTFPTLPDDLRPGGAVAMQYVDAFGDVLVDVPSVPGVEVVEPRGGGEARITDASPRGLAGQLACVCGSFPGPAAWNALLLDGQAVGSPASASGQMAWVQLPAGLAPGEHVFTGDASAGFPATDRATTLVLQVSGEIDSSKLRQLQTTPMRLWIVGTEEPLDLRVRNLTPGIISIDGGVDQIIRTSGGARNMLERTVRGLAPGAFNINYELGGESCPCGQTHYY